MAYYIIPREILQMLVHEGVVPDDCTRMELDVGVNGLVMLRFETYARAEHLERLARAFHAMAEAMAAANDAKSQDETP